MGQTKLMSLVEAVANVLIGYGIATVSQIIIFHWYDIKISLKDNLVIGLYFTVISIVRSYYVRRLFNRIFIRNHFPEVSKT